MLTAVLALAGCGAVGEEVPPLPVTARRGVVDPAWFLTNVQAGFEPWIGGEGLSTDAFALTRNGV